MQTITHGSAPLRLIPPTHPSHSEDQQQEQDIQSNPAASMFPLPTNSSSNLPNHHLPNGTFRNPWPSANSNQSHLLHLINTRIPLQLAKKFITHLKPVKTLPADLKLYRLFGSISNLQSIYTYDEFQTVPSTIRSHVFHQGGPYPMDWTQEIKTNYDHLDFDTIKTLAKRQPHLKYFVPLGLKAWFDSVPVPSDQVVELDWWQSCGPDGPASASQKSSVMERINGNGSEKTSIQITCVPAQHSSGRSLLDQNMTLWCGWIIEQTGSSLKLQVPTPRPIPTPRSSSDPLKSPSPNSRSPKTFKNRKNLSSNDGPSSDTQPPTRKRCCIYFAGDTGYRSPHDRDLVCPAFKEIGAKFGPIDFSMIPIWRGGTLSFVSWAGLRISDPSFLVAQHATPEDAVRIHLDVKSKHSIGIHHSCFVGNDQESLEALIELNRFKTIYKVPDDFYTFEGFGVVDVGETVQLDIL